MGVCSDCVDSFRPIERIVTPGPKPSLRSFLSNKVNLNG